MNKAQIELGFYLLGLWEVKNPTTTKHNEQEINETLGKKTPCESFVKNETNFVWSTVRELSPLWESEGLEIAREREHVAREEWAMSVERKE